MPLLLSLACVAGPQDTAPELEPAVLLGTGEWEWQDLYEEINVILGPQGGYHILGSVRVRGLVPGDPENLEDLEDRVDQLLPSRHDIFPFSHLFDVC